MILGLDLSSVSTGWAVIDNSLALKDYGRIDFSAKKSIKERMIILAELIKEIILLYKPNLVIIEDTFISQNPKTSKLLNKLSGVAIYTCTVMLGVETPIALVYPNSIRSALFPNKKVDKKDIFCYIKQKYKLKLDFKTGNDITDAIAAAMYPLIKELDKKWIL